MSATFAKTIVIILVLGLTTVSILLIFLYDSKKYIYYKVTYRVNVNYTKDLEKHYTATDDIVVSIKRKVDKEYFRRYILWNLEYELNKGSKNPAQIIKVEILNYERIS